ncbi:MAG TPA: hypothetical protein VK436_02975 [Methanocella sp.]|nr:hypothetical protein [Methanocella sp.]
MLRIGILTPVVRILCIIVLLMGVGLAFQPIATAAGSVVHGNVYDWSTFGTVSNAVVEVYSQPDKTLVDRYVVKSGSYEFSLPNGSYMLHGSAGTPGTPSEIDTTENITVTDSGDYTIDLILFPPIGLDDLDTINNSDYLTGVVNVTEGLNGTSTTSPPMQNSQSTQTSPPSSLLGSNRFVYLGMGVIVIAIGIVLLSFIFLRSSKKTRSSKEKKGPIWGIEEAVRATSPPMGDSEVEGQLSEDDAGKTPVTPPKMVISVQEQLLPQDCREVLAIMEKNGGRITQLDLRKALPYSEAKVSLIVSDLESRGIVKKIKKGRGNVLIINRPGDPGQDK